MKRLFHFAFLGLIGLSLTVQTLRFYTDMSGHRAGLLQQAVEQGALVVWLGTAAALSKLLVNLVRSVRRSEARVLVLAYGAILAWPLLLGLLNVASSVAAQSDAAEVPGHQALLSHALEQGGPEAPPSRDFLAGRAWAGEHKLTSKYDCPGSEEFRRGCLLRLRETFNEQEAAGHAWAERNHPQRSSHCISESPHAMLGCLRWRGKQPGAQKTWPHGYTTTAECRIEVGALSDMTYKLYVSDGNTRGAEVNRRRHWIPTLQQCDLIDRRVQDPMMFEAYAQLSALVRKMQEGARPTDEEHAAFHRGYTEVSKVPDQPYKDAYLQLAAEYLERHAGVFQEYRPQHPRISCDEYAAKIEEMRRLDAARVEEIRSLRSADRVTNTKRYEELNQQRIDMLWDWKYFTDGAKEMGCAIPG